MVMGQSDRVREIVRSEYVQRALAKGQRTFQVSAREVLHKAEEDPEFPRARTPLICNVLQSKKLLDENGLTIERIDGPRSRQSRTVVVHYAFRNQSMHRASGAPGAATLQEAKTETPEERARRLGTKLLGLMKEEIAQYGGGKAYLRWVRGDDQDAA